MLTLNTDTYERLVRPLLFALPPESAQAVAEFAMSRAGLWKMLSPVLRGPVGGSAVTIAGLELANAVGLAAGSDKECKFLPSLAAIGSCSTSAAMSID